MSSVHTRNELIKHSAAVHINNTLSLLERKVSNILLNRALAQMEKKEEHIISIKDLCMALNIPDNKNYEMLKVALRSLSQTQVEWNILNKDKKNKWGISSIIASVEIENGNCTYSYSAAMKKLFSNPNIYAKLNMAVQAGFNSKYSIALWEYIMEFISTNSKGPVVKNFISIEALRKLLGVENNKYYQEFSNFNREILKKSIKEINTISDLEVEIDYIKNNKKVESIEFLVKRNTENTKALPFLPTNNFVSDSLETKQREEIINELERECFFTKILAEEAVNTYDLERIRLVVDYAKKQNPKNISAYIRKALKEQWRLINGNNENNEYSSESISAFVDQHIEGIEDGVWKQILMTLRSRYGDGIFKSWFKDFASMSYESDEVLMINMPKSTDFNMNWIKENYYTGILESCQKHMQNVLIVKFQRQA